MLSYILEVSLCWGAFYLFYWLLLSRETFFHFNRWYLLGTMLLGLVIPLVEWGWLFEQPEMMTIYLQPITVGVQTLEVTVTAAATPTISFSDILRWIYFLGFIFFTIRLVIGVTQIARLYFQSERTNQPHYQLVLTNKPHQPFSFFQLLFLSKNISLDAHDEAQILLHEQAHIRGWHSVDVVLIELLNATFWCSPFIYLYRRSLRTVHEYIADASVLRTTERKQYGHLLIRHAQSGPALVIANHFHSQLKKRILMMMQPKSSRRHLAKYLLALPLMALLVMAFAQRHNWTGEFPTAFTSILTGDYDEAKIRQELQKAMTENVDSTYMDDSGTTVFMRTGLQIDRCHAIYTRLVEEYPDRKVAIQKVVKEVAGANGITFTIKDQETIFYELTENFKITNAKRDTIPPFLKPSLVQLNTTPIAANEYDFEIYYPDGRIEKLPAGTDINKHIGSLENLVKVDIQFAEEEKIAKIWINKNQVDEPALYPGCDGEKEAAKRRECSDNYLMLFVAKNIKYPKEARQQGVEGQVIVQFQISESGKVHSPKIVKDIGSGCDEEVLRIVNQMPSWTPAKKDGKPVASEFVLPVQFLLNSSDLKADPKKDTLVIFDPQTYEKQTKVFDEKGVVVVGNSEKMASSRKNEIVEDNKIYTFVEQQPEFPGGTSELFKWIASNLKYPKEARERELEGTTYIGFVIEKDGSISNVEVKRGILNGKLLDEEAMRVTKLMPKWYPGKQGGEAIRTLYTLPIKFKLGYEEPAAPKAVETPSLKIGERSLVLEGFKATPNPTSGLLNLSFKGEAKPTVVSVYDMQGKELYGLTLKDFSGSFYQQIDLKQAPKGTLLLSIRQGEKVFTEKIILQ